MALGSGISARAISELERIRRCNGAYIISARTLITALLDYAEDRIAEGRIARYEMATLRMMITIFLEGVEALLYAYLRYLNVLGLLEGPSAAVIAR